MSKRDTPLVKRDVVRILSISSHEYETATASGLLAASVLLPEDPTERLSFHNFWDMLEFSLVRNVDAFTGAKEAKRSLASEFSDHISEIDGELAIGTGDSDLDLELMKNGWTDKTGIRELPHDLVNHYARLLLLTLRHVHSAARATMRKDTVAATKHGRTIMPSALRLGHLMPRMVA